MFGISGTELFFIMVFALLIFGPKELPKFGRTVGRAMAEFKRAQASMEAMIRAEMLAEERKANEAEKSADAVAESVPDYADDDDDDDDEEDEE